MTLLLSGGAEGADSLWDAYARHAGHDVIHWSFAGHKSKLANVYKLSDLELAQATPFVIRANKSLKRRFPGQNAYVDNLLRRNYFQIAETSAVYAIAPFGRGTGLNIEGGTAWACQMYVDQFIYDRRSWKKCQLFLFETTSLQWFEWEIDNWIPKSKPPVPEDTYAGIGSRKLNPSALMAFDAFTVDQ